MTYRFLEHTADVQFEADGGSIEEAFSSSFLALKETISGEIAISDKIKKKLEIKGEDLQNLLYKFLEEFLFLLDSEDFLASKIDRLEIDEKTFTLSAEVSGDNGQHYNFTNDVKAITYNEMSVEEKDGKWVVRVVLDV